MFRKFFDLKVYNLYNVFNKCKNLKDLKIKEIAEKVIFEEENMLWK